MCALLCLLLFMILLCACYVAKSARLSVLCLQFIYFIGLVIISCDNIEYMITSGDSIFDRKNKIRERMNKELTATDDASKLMLMSSLLGFNESYADANNKYKSPLKRKEKNQQYEAKIIYNLNMVERILDTPSYCFDNAFTSDDVKTVYSLIWKNYNPMAYALRWLWMVTGHNNAILNYELMLSAWASIDMAVALIQDYVPEYNPLKWKGKIREDVDLDWNMLNGSVALIGINAFADGTAMMINGYPVEFCKENVKAMTRDEDRIIIKDEDKMAEYVHEKEQLRDAYMSKTTPIINEIKAMLSYNKNNYPFMIDLNDDESNEGK